MLAGAPVAGSGVTVAGGAEAIDGDGEGCAPVAVVAGLGAGLVGSSGAITEGQLRLWWRLVQRLRNWEMRSKVARPLWHVPLGFCWGGS